MSHPTISLPAFIDLLSGSSSRAAQDRLAAIQSKMQEYEKHMARMKRANFTKTQQAQLQNSIEKTKQTSEDVQLKFYHRIAELERTKALMEAMYEFVVWLKVWVLVLRGGVNGVKRDGGEDMAKRSSCRVVPKQKLSEEAEKKVAALEKSALGFETYDRARVTLGMKSSAGDARERAVGMSVEKAYKKLMESEKKMAKGGEEGRKWLGEDGK
ncbi:hypothetical protein Slin15195_G126760 [Septoria linicola]|uniref:Uncharacterized protein n=1 Tax=Septoria linicola TaxID=215465 RepID=A0A9Q9EQZ6_9PEZI|nr:hypothetical protein Slin15195_G126760 [Septoria linicola]